MQSGDNAQENVHNCGAVECKIVNYWEFIHSTALRLE